VNRAAAPPKVVVFGSLNMDLVLRVPRAPGAGETLTAHGFATHPGGKGANQAVACARQGARVVMAGRVGEDAFGEALRAAVLADGIDARHVVPTAGLTTGLALIMVDDAAENRITIVPGANAVVTEADADGIREELATARVLMLQCEVPMAAVQRAAELAREAGCAVVLNPAPAQPLPEALWGNVDILVLNETEAALLGGASVRDVRTAGEVGLMLHARGPRHVIVTLGSDGLVIANDRGVRHFAALPVKAVDTTAAGDTFIGALCAALAGGEPMDAGLARGIRAAALCVTRAGAQASIPRYEELA
jgi:ribokinase